MKVNKENFMERVKTENWALAHINALVGKAPYIKTIEDEDFSKDDFDILCWLLNCDPKYLSGERDAILLDEVPDKKNTVFGPNHITKDNFDGNFDIELFSANSRVGKVIFRQALADGGIYLPITVTAAISRAAMENGFYFNRTNTSLLATPYNINADDVKLIIEKMEKLTINQLCDVEKYAKYLRKSAIIKRQYSMM